MTKTYTKTPADYLREPYARLLIPEEDGRFSAEILEFPGCFSQGDTAEEAIRNLDEVAQSWIAATLEQGKPIPEPSANFGASGRIALRLPRGLHKRAMRLAEREKVSLNTFLVEAIAARVEAKELSRGVVRQVKQLIQEMEQRLTRQTAQRGFEMAASLVTGWGGADLTAPRFGSVIEGRGYRPPRQPDIDSVNIDEREAPLDELFSTTLY
jgi:predicted RNase H-like HicB family nuclease